ncbi:DNA endonuclease RBBP8-like isoform X1 [Stegostoma tigrinum]|uniref:DNA endonuclease RBBP8-like isoform X1 n=2 Tax=Stegostoma tigrinum TaxID=3053191 RepID=UPI00287021AE|nr:DNA endonuclease RBBP8-like isoform X1 [Stegostoma tigrinum]XP_048385507.2 DNA endonuclease RBBP8-like isoform X1 [Stegostoma tigrinum]XP_048385508.2 DNA endonuclease RBBP8-like isoform X1 [Stegostoma tigrinum]XP_048385510.2 DNA endonuclease RBBP8-like isoform X1 [Stegostoma tigrinum]XP_048385511.2 DNA endonuclease RBBP8-like isoform X1 [Stegostoma tigrinum]XP_048385512.2 DNA endonuclease RBBP8-like isoform X1 [Stegostoma tigrinum]XP_048385513.2 DNA endonuclease RBBP8-like isoform X1 [Steg
MNSSSANCGSPSTGSTAEAAVDVFKEIWTKLKECHDNEVQVLQIKVSKLKKERCLDAQRLEEYYNKNQQLREQQKALHDNIKVLEDRLRAGLCDRCAVTEEHMKKKQLEFENIRQQNLKLITELMNEKINLQEENKKLSDQLESLEHQLKEQQQEVTGAADHDDGIIPDSPILSLSTSIVSRMRRRKENCRIRYTEHAHAEPSGLQCDDETCKMLLARFSGIIPPIQDEEVLVADSCDLEQSPQKTTQKLKEHLSVEKNSFNLAAVVAETLGLGISEEHDLQSLLKSQRDITMSTQIPHNVLKKVISKAVNSELLEDSATGFTCAAEANEQSGNWISQCKSPVFGASADFTDQEMKLFQFIEESKPGEQRIAKNHIEIKSDTAGNTSCLPTSNRSTKRKKMEDERDLLTNYEKPSFNKENLPSKSEKAVSVNSDNLDKPLDLSDHVSSGRLGDRSHGKDSVCSKLMQVNPLESLKQSIKTANFRRAYNGLNKDPQDDVYVQETIGRSRSEICQEVKVKSEKNDEHGNSSICRYSHQQSGDFSQNEQLPSDRQGLEVEVPTRKVAKTDSSESEPTSVLQPNPNPSATVAKCGNTDNDGTKSESIQWSMDPGADCTMVASEVNSKKSIRQPGMNSLDMDCTYVSESMLLKPKESRINKPILGSRHIMDDSLAEAFDRTAYGEYESYPEEMKSPHNVYDSVFQEEPEKIKNESFAQPYLNSGKRKNTVVNFPHVEIVRNKEERKKLYGHTCKECEVYYADLPEEERLKKLANCSRHRFRYIPPNTPENFWEVGFPSTQTCVDRGYIKEESTPCQRPRRRRPYNPTFSPKGKEQNIT